MLQRWIVAAKLSLLSLRSAHHRTNHLPTTCRTLYWHIPTTLPRKCRRHTDDLLTTLPTRTGHMPTTLPTHTDDATEEIQTIPICRPLETLLLICLFVCLFVFFRRFLIVWSNGVMQWKSPEEQACFLGNKWFEHSEWRRSDVRPCIFMSLLAITKTTGKLGTNQYRKTLGIARRDWIRARTTISTYCLPGCTNSNSC